MNREEMIKALLQKLPYLKGDRLTYIEGRVDKYLEFNEEKCNSKEKEAS